MHISLPIFLFFFFFFFCVNTFANAAIFQAVTPDYACQQVVVTGTQGESWSNINFICDGNTANYANTAGSLKSNSPSKIFTASNFGMNVLNDTNIDGVVVIVTARTDTSSASHDISVQLTNSRISAEKTNTKTTSSTLSDIFIGGQNDKWGITWIPSDFSTINVACQFSRSSPAAGAAVVYGVQLRAYYSITLVLSSVTPSEVTALFPDAPNINVTVTGATFLVFPGNRILCRFGSVLTEGSLINSTAIICHVPSQALYGSYPLSVSLDEGVTYTNSINFNYTCNSGILCNDRGICQNNGTCLCNIGWSGPSCTIQTCGNGQFDAGESCDDGNLFNEDGCNSICQIEHGWTCSENFPSVCNVCGNGVLEGMETCDDGNIVSNDGCSALCGIELNYICQGSPSVCFICGNSQIGTGEECDDGNMANGDGCSNTCQLENGWICTETVPSQCIRCGDGVHQQGETCDDVNVINGDGCSSSCTVELGYACPIVGVCHTVCGDGYIRGAEICDDGNLVNGDGCNSQCGSVVGWYCSNEPSVCVEICGDGNKTKYEQCDDKNLVSGDGCSDSCIIEIGFTCSGSPSVCELGCGSGNKSSGEECDDGNILNNDGCTSACAIEPGWICDNSTPNTCQEVCGDGVVTRSEDCDDGNNINMDGCSATCEVESGFNCTGEPSQCHNCQNGIIEAPESCDDGNNLEGDGCSSVCTIELNYACFGTPSVCAICGNGIRSTIEECDDGNSQTNDGCENCRIEIGWNCSKASPSLCRSVCGDSMIVGNEGCDDGNSLNGDGCSSTCQIEAGWMCVTTDISHCNEICGNFITTVGEQCDDGNTVSGDGCFNCTIELGWACDGNSTCLPACGDGLIISNEQCDDGNNKSNDGCSSKCKFEIGYNCTQTVNGTVCTAFCGDGRVKYGETCDDANTNPNDGCDMCQVVSGYQCSGEPSSCHVVCSDGIIINDEQCDDGNSIDGDGCSFRCEIEYGWTCNGLPSNCSAVCGDSVIFGDEECDDGNIVSNDGCSSCRKDFGYYCAGQPSRCTSRCGDGILVTVTEECDDGDVQSNDGCSASCVLEPGYNCSASSCKPICGDLLIVGGETCEDGNSRSDDGCSTDCQVEVGWVCVQNGTSICTSTCQDGIKSSVEECDDAMNGTSGCSETCTILSGWQCQIISDRSYCSGVCGDGILIGLEECDDSNSINRDGCSSTCQLEYGWECSGTPSVCEFQQLQENSGDSGILTVVIAASASVIGVILFGIIIFIVIRYKRLQNAQLPTVSTTPSSARWSVNSVSLEMDGSTNYGSIGAPSVKSSMQLRSWMLNFRDIEIKEKLGQGAYGMVYKAKWRNQDVAVKMMIGEPTASDLNDFINEAEVMSSIPPHVNVAQLTGICVKPRCIVVKYYPNGNLYDYIRRHQLTMSQKVKILQDIAAGCVHLHREGIVHRDLASRNVLLSDTMDAVLCDFGFARSLLTTEEGKTQSLVGPVKWMSIEGLESQSYSSMSDVWSFGVTAWEVLTVKEPFEAYNLAQTANFVINGKIKEILAFPSNCPITLVQLIQSCWEKDPAARPTMEDLHSSLQGIQATLG